MGLVQMMLIGLVVTAIATGLAYLLFGNTVAIIVAMVVGIASQHGLLFSVTMFNWPQTND